ncbi:MAG: hypothetical protein FWD46_06075 [Cystobacterineae bacterium]|nr:hypothetical protein [Cystobacterineae bacterium]
MCVFSIMLGMAVCGGSAAAADIELMSLSRTTATAAEAGNQFTADSGIYADVSNLTAWSDNTQKAVGGTGRTPIVFNNAQTTGGWKPISVAGLDNADAFQIQFSTLGYENIRFTCTQKSTGSGPNAFLLAYSIGNPEGPYTLIANSETGTNGIPAITRMSNDTYAALVASYTDFVLPSEMDNQTEVYLRVVFNGLTTLGQNGNTSINDIVVVGDESGSNTVVNKTALNALISEASQRVESDYTAGSWATFAAALANAQTIALENEATQQQVNAARVALQAAMSALTRPGDVIELIEWPGSPSVSAWDLTPTFLADSSGLDFHNGQLYAVDNGTGTFWILDVAMDGSLSFVPGFEHGKRVNFKSVQSAKGPDAEGITVDADGFVYIASERDNSRNNINWNVILMIDPHAPGTVLTALREWDITQSLPNVSANAGIEAVEWVSNADVAGKLFDQNTNAPFNPSNYPNAIANGVFFVALEANGHVYAYVFYDDETFVQIADIDSKLGGAMALDYDTYEGVLWVVADNGYGNRAAMLSFTGQSTVGITHVNPPGGLDVSKNCEGFAIAEARYTRDGQRPVYRFEDGVSSRALTIGSINSDYHAVNKAALAAAIEAALGKAEADHTPASWAEFAAALTEAQHVFADANATQSQVDAAAARLTHAKDVLEPSDKEPGEEPGEEPGNKEPGDETSTQEPINAKKTSSGCSSVSGAPLAMLALAFWALARRRKT